MLLKNHIVNNFSPEYYFDFEVDPMTSETNLGTAGSVGSWTTSGSASVYRFDTSETYYGRWCSDWGVLALGTAFMRNTNAGIGTMAATRNFGVHFSIAMNSNTNANPKNLITFNFGTGEFNIAQGGTASSNLYKDKLVIRNGSTIRGASSSTIHATGTYGGVVSSGNWNNTADGIVLIGVIFKTDGTADMYIDGVYEGTATGLTAPSSFTNLQIAGGTTSANTLVGHIAISDSFTAANFANFAAVFRVGIPETVATSSALMYDPVVSATSPNADIAAELMTASALFPAPSPMIAEINPADLLTGSALMNDATVDFSTPVNITADIMTVSAQSGDHEYSWLHTRTLNRTDYYDPATDARYVFAEISPTSPNTNLWTESEQTGPSYPTISKSGNYLLFKPDIGDINTAEIVKIVLRFYADDALNNVSFNVYALTTNWNLNNVTYNTRPTESLIQDDGIVYNVANGAPTNLDITTAYEYLTSHSNHGFAIKIDSASTTNDFDIAVNSYGDPQVLVYLNVPPTNVSVSADVMTASALMNDATPVMGINKEVFADLSTAIASMSDPSVSGSADVAIPLFTGSVTMREAFSHISEDNIPGVLIATGFMNNPSISTDTTIAADLMTVSGQLNDGIISIGFDINISADVMVLELALMREIVQNWFGYEYWRALYTIATKQVADPEQTPNETWSMYNFAGKYDAAHKLSIAGSQDRTTALTLWYKLDRATRNALGWFALDGSDFPQSSALWQYSDEGILYNRIYNEVPRTVSSVPASAYFTKFLHNGPENRGQLLFTGQEYLFFPDGDQAQYGSVGRGTAFGTYYGSAELTFRTSKQTQSLFSSNNRSIGLREDFTSHDTVKDVNYQTGPKVVNSFITPFTIYGDSSRDINDDDRKKTSASYAIYDDFNKFVRYSGTDQFRNYAEIRMVDGVIAFYYKNRLTGEEKLFKGTTYLADDKNHHIVLNRTNDGFGKDNKADKRKPSCLEIWVDGNLEVRTTEIDDTYWFNTFQYLGIGWKDDYVENDDLAQVREIRPVAKSEDAFIGTMGNFLIRNGRPLTENEIKYLARACFGIKAKKAKKTTVSAKMNNPTVSTNSANILRLYWNIEDKPQNGLAVSKPYGTMTYNVCKNMLSNPYETLNHDKANKNFVEKLEVKTVATRWLNIFNPSMVSVNSVVTQTYWGVGGDGFPYSSEMVGPSQYGEKYLPELIIGNYSVQVGDRVLLTGQKDPRENGVWVYQGLGNPMTRPNDLIRPEDLVGAVVYSRYGDYAGKYFACLNETVNFTEHYSLGHKIGDTTEFIWKEINYKDTFASSPIEGEYYLDDNFDARFIDINNDIDPNSYDIIAFVNYPETFNDVASQMSDYDSQYVYKKYKEFVETLKQAVISGKSLMINSPKLAYDFGLINKYEEIDQLISFEDADVAENNPFELNQNANRYFSNNRINKYKVTSIIAGLNDKETYEMVDFINYIPEESWKEDDYHIKYEYKENGHEVNDEFIIPSLPLRSVQAPDLFEFYAPNQVRRNKITAVPSANVVNGTIVTKLAANINSETVNPYTDYATTIVLEPGDTIDGSTISGKVFFNSVEDALTMARQEYNVGIIQDISIEDVDENEETILYQYSTSRIDRSRVEDIETSLDTTGQTVPTNAGGGPIVQAPTNQSNGTIRYEKDKLLTQKESILYPSLDEEIKAISEIPVYSMSYLGLKWLGGE